MPKKGGLEQFVDLRGAWQERGDGIFEGGGGAGVGKKEGMVFLRGGGGGRGWQERGDGIFEGGAGVDTPMPTMFVPFIYHPWDDKSSSNT